MKISLSPCTLFLLLLCVSGHAAAAGTFGCGKLNNPYGPYDYADPFDHSVRLPIVDDNHFTSQVEYLIAGQSSSIQGDLDYTLRAFPNHVRALDAMARFQLRQQGRGGARYTIECYFDRALRFRPDDAMVYLAYAIYLHRKQDLQGALELYTRSGELAPDSINLHYNWGLLYVDLKDYPAARAQAARAYSKGYPLPGLKNRLKALNEWGAAEEAAFAAGASFKAVRRPVKKP